ncbi:MAG: tetratricopeptide repeat protein [Bacteroidota bacterium]
MQLCAQQTKIDSLLRVLEEMDNDTNKVNTLIGLALAYTNTSAPGNIGNVHLYQDDYEQALAYYQRALEVDRVIGYELGEAINLGNIGLTYIEDSFTGLVQRRLGDSNEEVLAF